MAKSNTTAAEPAQPSPPSDADTVRAKLQRLDELRRQAKAAIAPNAAPVPKAKPKRRPRFSGSWGCGGPVAKDC